MKTRHGSEGVKKAKKEQCVKAACVVYAAPLAVSVLRHKPPTTVATVVSECADP
ncbi:hypothetical protein E2C01_071519 [Portunus trituberculatus]|uniref:Uncharacterized protein n=1 Tax=Portunus trituberculatus TaxID=210409 RepID=A0A5B7I4N3_PORTR|nr:hypothetical protein [Portunus trituberculatus]